MSESGKLTLVTLRGNIRECIARNRVPHSYRDIQLTAKAHAFAAAVGALDPETASRADLASIYERFGYDRWFFVCPECSRCGAKVELVVEVDPCFEDSYPVSLCADCIREMAALVASPGDAGPRSAPGGTADV